MDEEIVKCNSCNSVIEYTKDDVHTFEEWYELGDGMFNHTDYIRCPKCNKFIMLTTYVK